MVDLYTDVAVLNSIICVGCVREYIVIVRSNNKGIAELNMLYLRIMCLLVKTIIMSCDITNSSLLLLTISTVPYS